MRIKCRQRSQGRPNNVRKLLKCQISSHKSIPCSPEAYVLHCILTVTSYTHRLRCIYALQTAVMVCHIDRSFLRRLRKRPGPYRHLQGAGACRPASWMQGSRLLVYGCPCWSYASIVICL